MMDYINGLDAVEIISSFLIVEGGSRRQCHKMRTWFHCLLLLHLISAVILLDLSADRQLLCECTTTHCKSTNRTTCHSQYKCYSQYLDKKDGSHPVTRGCVQGNTPILCENRRPEVRKKLKWPYLKCCDNGDLCNSVDLTTPSWVSNISSEYSAVNHLNTTNVPVSTSDAGSKLLTFWARNTERQGRDHWPISKPTVLAVLFVGLFLLISILAFGFYILKTQSSYLSELRKGYIRATEGESVVTSVGPSLHKTVISTSSEQNNNLKSVETMKSDTV
ncbi:BMP and activin membrane-bound inhibitor homolog isoform X2 [Zootermopsis nevadensis]|uniref:BMP and activin membrane-bound inhibitor homolog isoform X2 n=1 Tax=Zootermopsis nevadensis TaxID=136037 RepID=UPI000B8E4BD5|nr:BMP and activin membrane-bound inhibitor homolog isoform X2 [Zootermopsis nevadensis]